MHRADFWEPPLKSSDYSTYDSYRVDSEVFREPKSPCYICSGLKRNSKQMAKDIPCKPDIIR